MGSRAAWFLFAVFVCSSACDHTPEAFVEPHPGTPLTFSPGDAPPSKAELIEVARYYYPAMEYAEQQAHSGGEAADIEHSTPQWKARDAVHTQAMKNREPWRDLVRTLETKLPDYRVADRTLSYLNEPAYVIELVPKDESREGVLRGAVSVIAPVYFVFQTVGFRTMDDPKEPVLSTIRHPMDPEFQAAAAALEHEILARYPYHPLDRETALTIVPEIRAGSLWYRETTLLDFLMFTSW